MTSLQAVNRDAVLTSLRNHREELRRYQVKKLWLFGSVARDAPQSGDVDLLVEFDVTPSLTEFVSLKAFLEDVLEKPVDFVSRPGCKNRFLQAIEGDLRDVS